MMSPINIIRPIYYVIYYMRFIFTDRVHCRQHAILYNYDAIHDNYCTSNIFNEEETNLFSYPIMSNYKIMKTEKILLSDKLL